MQPRRILVPINLPNNSFDTLLVAKEMAEEFSVCLTLLTVVRINIGFESRVYDELCLESEAALHRIKARFLGDVPDVRVRVRAGKPYEQIVAEAKSTGAELILLSSPKRSLWKRVFSDGTVKGVLRAAPCPTLVLPRNWKAAPESCRDAAHSAAGVAAHWFASAPICR
jgi:nucleotide-binding universal stress UspA family protein